MPAFISTFPRTRKGHRLQVPAAVQRPWSDKRGREGANESLCEFYVNICQTFTVKETN